MKKIYLLYTIRNGVKTYLRYGQNGGEGIGYSLYLGKIACFESIDLANETRACFDDPKAWETERFINAEEDD